MLLTKREEQLLKAFQTYGKLSLNQISDILKVSQRTVYRTISELTDSLNTVNVSILKDKTKYYLSGEVEGIKDFFSQASFDSSQRLNLITYRLIISQQAVTNEELQQEFGVSNVTIIQDIAEIEKRLADFDLFLQRTNGYSIVQKNAQTRRFLAILMSNNLSISDFWNQDYGYFQELNLEKLTLAQTIFQDYQDDLPELDAKMTEFFIILLALSSWGEIEEKSSKVSRLALDFSKKVFARFSKETAEFYNIQEILFFASVLDELLIKRQESPLYNESFDGEFFYRISNLIDKVSRYTKIDFRKDPVLFKFLFHHIRLSLAVPVIFNTSSKRHITYLAAHKNEYLHTVVSLLVQDMFPNYLNSEAEYELLTLHFASSLRRSPDIYPIRILLLTDERPLARELLLSRIKSVAPFVEKIDFKPLLQFKEEDRQYYHTVLSTKPLQGDVAYLVSIYPDAKEILSLQEYLQDIQANQSIILKEETAVLSGLNRQDYLAASQTLLQQFILEDVANSATFEATVREIMEKIPVISDQTYLSDKLLNRFERSPFAIPETNLALLHTQSSKVRQSFFGIYNLKQPVKALSMTKEEEVTKRILVMLTKIDESSEIRDLMTAISQSLIENHLYTEIYKTGNREIIYQLLNKIFTERIKKLEN